MGIRIGIGGIELGSGGISWADYWAAKYPQYAAYTETVEADGGIIVSHKEAGQAMSDAIEGDYFDDIAFLTNKEFGVKYNEAGKQ